jgi:glycosyltransferase involved in cell wall biosynthesis
MNVCAGSGTAAGRVRSDAGVNRVMSKPFVSVLIDTYNHERFIEQAITSVLEQDISLSGAEIVVVDDGSTDRTPELVRKFELRVRLLRKPNGGQASAFNAGLAGCHGEIVAFLDGDDWWEREKLRTILDAFATNPEIGAVGHALYEVDAQGRRLYLNRPDRPYQCFFQTVEEGLWFRELMSFMGTSRLAIRRRVIDRLLPVPDALTIEADEYLATLAVAISGALVLDQPLTNYRFHPGNLYQYGSFDLEKSRRKADALTSLVRVLRERLDAFGIPAEITRAMLRSRWVEAERLRLSVYGGAPWQTYQVERLAHRENYRQYSRGYHLFLGLVLGLACLLPSRTFYRVRNWYSSRELRRIRRMIGEPIPVESLVVRRAEMEGGIK